MYGPRPPCRCYLAALSFLQTPEITTATMAIKDLFRTVFSSKPKTANDGRDQWPSRASFILAAMGGCVGLGNILRYVRGLPSRHV